MDVERWVDERLRSLDSEVAQTSAQAVLAGLRKREARRRVVKRRTVALGIAAMLTCAGLAAVITVRDFHRGDLPLAKLPPPAAANPVSQPQTVAAQPPKTDNKIAAVTLRPKPVPPMRAQAVAAPAVNTNFREIGSPSATIVCEVYIDYGCPPCARFYRDTVPLLIAQYVDTGKVRLLRRDFPLPFHRYAMRAAQFANAAGLVGQFQKVNDQIFQTQSEWAQDGDVDRQVAAVLSPENMARVRDVMKDTHRLDEMIAHDRALAADDHIDQTPTVILAANGKRRRIVNVTSFAVLKDSIDDLLAQQQ